MSYADRLTESDEFKAWEEGRFYYYRGRLQGLKDIQRVTRFKVNASLQSIINKMVDEQQEFLDEVYGLGHDWYEDDDE